MGWITQFWTRFCRTLVFQSKCHQCGNVINLWPHERLLWAEELHGEFVVVGSKDLDQLRLHPSLLGLAGHWRPGSRSRIKDRNHGLNQGWYPCDQFWQIGDLGWAMRRGEPSFDTCPVASITILTPSGVSVTIVTRSSQGSRTIISSVRTQFCQCRASIIFSQSLCTQYTLYYSDFYAVGPKSLIDQQIQPQTTLPVSLLTERIAAWLVSNASYAT